MFCFDDIEYGFFLVLKVKECYVCGGLGNYLVFSFILRLLFYFYRIDYVGILWMKERKFWFYIIE